MAKGTNSEVAGKKVTRPDTTSKRVEAIPAVNVHGHSPNFPGEPNNPGDVINIGQSGENHGWFHN